MSVSPNSIAAFCVNLLFALVFPAFLFLFTRKKTGIGAKPFFVGCGVFFVFVVIIESLFHNLILLLPFGPALRSNIIASSIYGGLCAGIFEETGRLIAFKSILKKDADRNETAIMYGAGHGGFEVFFILFSGMITNLVFAICINTGNTAVITAKLPAEQIALIESTFQTLVDTKSITFYFAIIERISAVILHISLSILVWFAVKNKKQWWLYPVSILLHACMDFIAGFMNAAGDSIVLIEIIIFLFTITVFLITLLKVWLKNLPDSENIEKQNT